MAYTKAMTDDGNGIWSGQLEGSDFGYSAIRNFVEAYPHLDYILSVFDSTSGDIIRIECNYDEIADIAAYIAEKESAQIDFITESPLTTAYVVCMTFNNGVIKVPGIYMMQNDELVLVEEYDADEDE